MSTSTGWICANCQRQLRSTRLRLAHLPTRRSFVSLQDIDRGKRVDSSAKGRENPQQGPNNASASENDRETKVSDITPDSFLEKLFKSTGREPPASPLQLRYSQRLSQLKPASAPFKASASSAKSASNAREHSREGSLGQLEQGQDRERPVRFSPQQLPTSSAKQSDGRTSAFTKETEKEKEKTLAQDVSLSTEATGHVTSSTTSNSPTQSVPPNESGIQPENPSASLYEWGHSPSESSKRSSRSRLLKNSRSQKASSLLKSSEGLNGGRQRPSPVINQTKSTIHARDHLLIQKLWRSCNTEIQKGEHKNMAKISSVLTELLQAFVDNHDPVRAAEVWRTIKEQKLSPTLKQWSLMLELARRRRDMRSLDTIWNSMLAAGMLPDNVAWTTYISTVGRIRPFRLHYTIEELEAQWSYLKRNPALLEAGDLSEDKTLYAPSIVPYNAAIEAVIFKESKYLERILSKLSKIGVQPDADTFNTLLKRAVHFREGSHEVNRILKEMEKHGLKPDKITMTTLLDERLRDLNDDEDPEFIMHTIKTMFHELDAHGIKPAPHTYTTALTVLLHRKTPNIVAADAVMRHMRQNGIESIYAYTILISHYFTADPPQRTAADGLIARAKAGEIPVDLTFFDRAIEGYAWVGETDRMLECIRHLTKLGRTPGWFALWRALQHLSKAKYYDICEQIVNDVERQGGMGIYGVKTQKNGEPFFWELVSELRMRGMISPSGPEARYTQPAEMTGIGSLFRPNERSPDEGGVPLYDSMVLGNTVSGGEADIQ